MRFSFLQRPLRLRAVTFIELMVVLIIMMAFIGLSFPMLRGMHQKNEIAAAAREFAVTARLARQQAILRNRTVEICIDFQRDRYWMDLNPGTERRSSYSSHARTDKEEIEQVRDLGKGRGGLHVHSVQSATDPFGREQLIRVKFFKDGSATPTFVLFADNRPRYMTVEIAAATGNVRAFEGKPENWDDRTDVRRRGGGRMR